MGNYCRKCDIFVANLRNLFSPKLGGLAAEKSCIALFLLQVIGWDIISPQLFTLWETVAMCKKCGFQARKHPKIH